MDLHKIIMSVKRGFSLFPSSVFNIKEADYDSILDQLAAEEDFSGFNEQNNVNNPIPLKTPSNVVPYSSDESEFRRLVSDWIFKNKQNILIENSGGFQGKTFLDVVIEPSLALYNAININPDFFNIMVSEIVSQTGIRRGMAEIFVNIMKKKTETMQNNINNPVNKPDDANSDDINLDVIMSKKLLNMSSEARESFFETTGRFDMDEYAISVSERQFGSPKNGLMDQRINFFVYNTDKLPTLDNDTLDKIQNKFKEYGIYGKNIGDYFQQITGRKNKSAHNSIIRFLYDLAGDKLLRTLLYLINNMDMSVILWFKQGLMQEKAIDAYRAKSTSMYSQDEKGFSLIDNISEKRPIYEDKNRDKPDSDIESNAIANVTAIYLKDTLTQMDGLRRKAVGNMMTDTIVGFKQAEENVSNTKFVNKIKEKSANAKVVGYLGYYSTAEQINAFSSPIVDQVYDLLSEKKRVMRHRDVHSYNKETGSVRIPSDVVDSILNIGKGRIDQEEGGRRRSDPTDYFNLVKDYKEDIKAGRKKPFVMDWSSVVSSKFPIDVYFKLASLKEYIYELYKRYHNEHGSINQWEGYVKNHIKYSEEYNKYLLQFANIQPEDSFAVQEQKIDDFLFMTIKQFEYIPEHIIWLKQLGKKGDIGKGETEVIDKNEDDESEKKYQYRNLKTNIASIYYPLLWYIVDAMEQNRSDNIPDDEYSVEAVRGLIDLFDNYSNLKRFVANGRKANFFDPLHRTNTELYYLARREKMPEHIEKLMILYNKGITEHRKTYRGDIPALSLKSWYGEFFNDYDKYESLLWKRDNKIEQLEKNNEKREKTYSLLNDKIKNIVSADPPLEYNRILSNLDDDTRRYVLSEIQNWDLKSHLPVEVYKSFGLNKFSMPINKCNIREKEITGDPDNPRENTLVWIDEKMNELKDKLAGKLIEKGYSEGDIAALRLARMAYNRMMTKISSLEKMKRSSIKVACNINQINIEIKNAEKEFDNYFKSLFLL